MAGGIPLIVVGCQVSLFAVALEAFLLRLQLLVNILDLEADDRGRSVVQVEGQGIVEAVLMH